MATSTDIKNLIINKVESQAVFDYMVANSLTKEDELYLIQDENTAILYTAQALTEEQKAQARQNIGAMEDADIQVIVTNSLGTHNTATDAHNDIRELISRLTTRLNTLLDCDDETLDQTSEIVAYIKSNKSLIEGITTSKVNVDDIVNNLTTNVANKPLSAAMGVQLKALIDSVTGAVESVNGKTGAVTLTYTDVGADKSGAASEAVGTHEEDTDAHADLFGKKLDKSGGTMTGDLTLKGDPTADLHAATKKYTDSAANSAVSGHDTSASAHSDIRTLANNAQAAADAAAATANAAVPKAGGSMTGALTLAADPTEDMQAATKQYVDNEVCVVSITRW